MTAARAGGVKNLLSARGDGNLVAETMVEFEVIAPQIAVSIKGPRRRYLERQATYTVQVANPGTANCEEHRAGFTAAAGPQVCLRKQLGTLR